MITFLDENDAEYGALATIKVTNAVNGERSLTGTIVSGDYVLSKIERGWRLRFDDEYYVVTYAKPIDEGKNVQVSFDAVHQFFWDFGKSSVYDQLSDGSHTFRAYLDFIFNSSGYRYDIESSLTVKAFEKQSFGYKNRLSLFNDVITSTGVEFQVNGKVVRILAKVGTDLSTVVRKNFNLNELGIEKNIGNFVTYQKGFGAYFDEEDHSKGRLIAEYTSPLASVYGKLEADPLVDERYKQPESLLSALKETVDNSYTISVSLDMEDLTRAGYRYTQPVAGDYIMAINETLGFKEKIRIVSFTSEYDVAGQLIKHTVTCNDIGSVKKLSASYTQTQHQAANAEVNANTAYEFANKALVSANGKNTNYYGDTFPVDNPKGTLKKGDLLFLTVGDTVKQYYWNGSDWVINPVLDDVEAFKEQIAEELKDVPNREEFENKIAEELATSKAEIETQIETAKTQAESNAKEYADTINEETAKVAELANAAAGEIKADLVNVKDNLTATSLVANNAQAAVDEAKQELTEVASELNTAKQDLANSVAEVNTKVDSAKEELTQAKQDLMSHAQQLQTQANAQTELTKRVTTVETTANGTKTTVSELSKTVAQNGKDITSVTARTKTVEDDLTSTKTTLTQVQTTANSASQKTATLETGLNGLTAKFDNLRVGAVNLLKNTKSFTGSNIIGSSTILNETYQDCAIRYFKNSNPNSNFQDVVQFNNVVNPKVNSTYTISFWAKGSGTISTFFYGPQNYLQVASGYTNQGKTTSPYDGNVKFDLSDEWQRFWVVYKLKNAYPTNDTTVSKHLLFRHDNKNTDEELWVAGVQLEEGNIATDYSPNDSDIESKVAEYKQTADQNYASLQSNLQTLDGTVKQNKSEFDQTASQIKSSISAVEGKIPTEIGAVNLLKNSKTFTGSNIIGSGAVLSETYQGCAVRYLKVTGEVAIAEFINCVYPKLGGEYVASFWAKGNGEFRVYFHGNSGHLGVAEGLSSEGNMTTWSNGSISFNLTANWKRYWVKYKMKSEPASATSVGKHLLFRTPPNGSENEVYLAGVKLEEGNIVSGYEPAPEDTATQISNLSSQIKQTADGITLLATKTELNSAKTELQSGIKTATDKANNNAQTISTHTTQISALNTGLQAKVSQSDFNTLSGRVTTAENNITAKANELSSRITSVEGKIPTSVGSVNLFKGSRDFRGTGWVNNSNGVYAEDYQGVKIFKTQDSWNGRSQYFEAKTGEEYVFSAYVKSSAKTDNVTFYLVHESKQPMATGLVGFDSANIQDLVSFDLTDEYKRIAIKIKITKDGWIMPRIERFNSDNYLFFGGYKLERGNIATDWSPAPEDAISQISSLSSQIQQTADGMTLLATKTELNTAKNELQSGITTATNKANSNAQTISTHTTQISALNTGLSAKVSQSDFNTLSGRVTTAENNITAKANELTSKITSVEGKIPKSVGATNLLLYTADPWKAPSGYYQFDGVTKTDKTLNGSVVYKTNTAWTSLRLNLGKQLIDRRIVKIGEEFTYSVWMRTDQTPMNVRLFARFLGQSGADRLTGDIALTNQWQKFSVTFKVTEKMVASQTKLSWFGFEQTTNNEPGKYVYYACNKLERGNIATGYSPAPEDTAEQINYVSSEFKQTTDAIKASVSSLDKSTVKSSSLTINSDGIVMKAGKSTTDVANAIGSYFAVNQNAINLFSDKINVKGNMIVNGAITSDKIASKSINTAHLNGKIITADTIATNAVTADAIKAGAVTTDKMSANSINGDRIAAGTLDAAKIKAGSITASQIASGTITSNQIKAGGISSANIAAGAITGDKIAAGAIDANKIAANAITANMIRGGQLNSTNGATVFDLNAGTLTFNNDYGYIQRVANDKIFEITTWLHSADADSPEYLTSAFRIRKSDNSRQAGVKFTLNNTYDDKPTAAAIINADSLILSDSQNRTVLSIFSKGNFGNINMQGWGDIPVAQLYNCGLAVKDIGIGGHSKSLLNIVEELCKKANIPWV